MKYYITNLIIVTTFMIGSFMYINSDLNIFKRVDIINNNKDNININLENAIKINSVNTKEYKTGNFKISNSGNVDSGFKLKYRIYDTNIDINNIKLIIDDVIYNYNSIIDYECDEYTDLLIKSDTVKHNNENNVSLGFLVDSISDDMFISGNYVLNTMDLTAMS